MNEWREKITGTKAIRADKLRLLSRLKAERETLTQAKIDSDNMLAIARKAAGLVQDSLAEKFSGIVSRALATVFDEPMKFVIEFVERRNVSECDLWIEQNGERYDILRSTGGGVADVCSVCLQMAFVLLSDVDRVLIVDEIARHVDSEAQDRFAAVLSELCKELGFTILTVTHAPAFQEVADRVFHVSKKDGKSTVRVA